MALQVFSPMQDPKVAAVVAQARASRAKDRAPIVGKIREGLETGHSFFEKLDIVNSTYDETIRAYDTNGANVVVKYCGRNALREDRNDSQQKLLDGRNAANHGSSIVNYWLLMRAYQELEERGEIEHEHYAIVPIDCLAKIQVREDAHFERVYIVLERMNDLMELGAGPSLSWAYREMRSDFETVQAYLRGEAGANWSFALQISMSMILGNTNPDNIYDGKWVFAALHDSH